MKAYFDFHPQVMHDLHESVPFIYISTGTGPYNASLDPLMIDEWYRMAFRGGPAHPARPARRVATVSRTAGRRTTCSGSARDATLSGGSTRRSATAGRRPRTASCAAPANARGTAESTAPEVRWSLRNNINYLQRACSSRCTTWPRTAALPRTVPDHRQARRRQGRERGSHGLGLRCLAETPGTAPRLLRLLRHGIEIHSSDEAFSPLRTGLRRNRRRFEG